MIKTLFFGSCFLIFFSYFGYPISLLIIGLFRKKTINKKKIFPNVSIIITVFNEESRIKRKIENTLEIIYPKEKLQIIIASDGSLDDTNLITLSYKSLGIELLNIMKRSGKENAQKEALRIANGDIIVFTDVATMVEPYMLEKIVSNFEDPTIGCVSSEDRLAGKDGNPSGEGLYVRYEMMLRRLESRINSLVGLSGSLFAARRSVCHDFSGEMQSDFRTLLKSVEKGMRGIVDPDVVGVYHDVSNPNHEFERKTRTVLRGLTVYFENAEFLNIYKYGLFSYQYVCHKLLRWLIPIFLIVVFITSFLLVLESSRYLIFFVFQILFYGIAVIGWKSKHLYIKKIFKIPVYFLMVNISILFAWRRYLNNERIVMWNPSER